MIRKLTAALVCAVVVLAAAFGFYVGDYYRADRSVDEYLALDSSVKVEQADYGWYLDGPSEEDALIFYPGAKVDEKAYIPILYRFAEEGMDVCLVKMPFHLAFLGMNRAADVMRQYTYTNWYIGGHSLGGAMAANFAADHGDGISLRRRRHALLRQRRDLFLSGHSIKNTPEPKLGGVLCVMRIVSVKNRERYHSILLLIKITGTGRRSHQ
jgi:hypothetical protein